jgi:hypothetical protein
MEVGKTMRIKWLRLAPVLPLVVGTPIFCHFIAHDSPTSYALNASVSMLVGSGFMLWALN